MDLTIHVDEARGCIYVRAWGTVTSGEDIRDAMTGIAHHPHFVPTYSSIFDLRELEFNTLRSAEIVNLASQSAFADTARRVLVVRSAAQFGLSRMYQTHRAINSGDRDPINVVYTLEEALAWLGIDPEALPPPDGDIAADE